MNYITGEILNLFKRNHDVNALINSNHTILNKFYIVKLSNSFNIKFLKGSLRIIMILDMGKTCLKGSISMLYS